jgi:hypothetical protein
MMTTTTIVVDIHRAAGVARAMADGLATPRVIRKPLVAAGVTGDRSI